MKKGIERHHHFMLIDRPYQDAQTRLTVAAASGGLEERTPWMAARRMTTCAGKGAPGAGCAGATAGAVPGMVLGTALGAVGTVGAEAAATAPATLLRSERRRQEPSPTVWERL